MARKKFTTTLEEKSIKDLRKQAVDEDLDANDILEKAIRMYCRAMKGSKGQPIRVRVLPRYQQEEGNK